MVKKLLIVDDNEDSREAFKKVLELEGYEVEVASSGKEGLEKIKKHKFNLVLLDILMPKMSGLEMLKKIRKIKPNLKVMMVTVVEKSDTKKSSSGLGIEGYLVKPVENDNLTDAVSYVLKESK